MIYQAYLENGPSDLLSLAIRTNNQECQELLSGLLQKKVHLERAEEHFYDSIQKILDRNWMVKREAIKARIQSAQCSDEEVLELVKQFDELKRAPKLKVESGAASQG